MYGLIDKLRRLANVSPQVSQYLIVTGNYWAFTLTDGALRMLVVLHFHQLGYSPLEIALLFLFYEVFGVITNLVGGWLAAIIGLNKTMNFGLALQIGALAMLAVSPEMLTLAWVMVAQALSGIAKDLNKMSAKAAIKGLVPSDQSSLLYRWVALLTGSKNALKGAGFFLGGLLLSMLGFRLAVLVMAACLLIVWVASLIALKDPRSTESTAELSRQTTNRINPKFREIFSKNPAINHLALARFFLFGARDIWFVVALPVYLNANLGWQHASVGAFFALWVIGYGAVQSVAPSISGSSPTPRSLFYWALALTGLMTGITLFFGLSSSTELVLLIGLLIFGFLFAVNSALHSYFIVAFAQAERASMDVGFYYMANAMGRLIGTMLSGYLFMQFGLISCLLASLVFLLASSSVAFKLSLMSPRNTP